jgi:flagellar biosynthesis GTPase FlhF
VIRLKAQIMCSKYQPRTIVEYAAAMQMSPADQQLIPQALELLRDKPLRNFRVDIAADSLVQIDEAQMKRDRMEFLQAFGGFLQQALPVGQASPEMIPVMMELLKFGVQAFKAARPLEGQLEQTAEQIKQAAGQPRPDPAAEAAQAQAQMETQKFQAEQQAKAAEMQQEMQIEQMKAQNEMQLEQMRQQFEAQLKTQELAQKEQAERFKAELDAATRVMVARIQANPGLDIPMLEAQQAVSERVVQDMGAEVKAAMDRLAMLYENMAAANTENMQGIRSAMSALSAPKRIIRGPDGRAVGVEPMQAEMNLSSSVVTQ